MDLNYLVTITKILIILKYLMQLLIDYLMIKNYKLSMCRYQQDGNDLLSSLLPGIRCGYSASIVIQNKNQCRNDIQLLLKRRRLSNVSGTI